MKDPLHLRTTGLAALAVSALTFVALAAWVTYDPAPTRLDHAAYALFEGLDPQGDYQWGDTAFEEGADFVFFALLDLLVVYLAWRAQGVLLAGLVTTSIILQELVILSLQGALDRPRPDGAFETHGAFPSGHVANLVLPLLLVVFVILPLRPATSLLARRLVTPTVGLLVLYAVFRLASAEHWATDVIGAFALGVGWALASLMLVRPWVAPSRLPTGSPTTEPAASPRR